MMKNINNSFFFFLWNSYVSKYVQIILKCSSKEWDKIVWTLFYVFFLFKTLVWDNNEPSIAQKNNLLTIVSFANRSTWATIKLVLWHGRRFLQTSIFPTSWAKLISVTIQCQFSLTILHSEQGRWNGWIFPTTLSTI